DRFCPLLPVPECPEIKARQAADVYKLWQAWEQEAGRECPVPHWAIVWPAAQVLARYLLDHPKIVKEKEILEIGCGGAVVSISAKRSGSRQVWANDIDPVTLAVARENASANQVDIVFDSMNRIGTRTLPAVNLVLIADFFYMKTDSLMLTAQLHEWKNQGIEIIIADGGRAFVPAEYGEILHEQDQAVNHDLEGKNKRRVKIFRF
ncbi:MAG: methyltransferase, partial [Desulfobacteraceae bacterium]